MSMIILKGSKLKSALKSYAKNVATFKARNHQLAYSCLVHLEENHCASHLNTLYQAMPTAYRKSIRDYATAFGKCGYDKESDSFIYAKSKKSDLDGACAIAPADYAKASKSRDSKPFADRIAKMIERELKQEGGDHALARYLHEALNQRDQLLERKAKELASLKQDNQKLKAAS